MRKNKEKPNLRARIAEGFDASKEIVLDVPKIVFVGNGEAVIENYKSISEYTESLIVLDAKPVGLRLIGRNMEIKSITREMLFVVGQFEKFIFKKEG